MEGISNELFTAKSRGAVVLLAIYFYVIYIFALVFFIEEQGLATPSDISPETGNTTLCATVQGCAITLTRLTLYDGTGASPYRCSYQFSSVHRASAALYLAVALLCLIRSVSDPGDLWAIRPPPPLPISAVHMRSLQKLIAASMIHLSTESCHAGRSTPSRAEPAAPSHGCGCSP